MFFGFCPENIPFFIAKPVIFDLTGLHVASQGCMKKENVYQGVGLLVIVMIAYLLSATALASGLAYETVLIRESEVIQDGNQNQVVEQRPQLAEPQQLELDLQAGQAQVQRPQQLELDLQQQQQNAAPSEASKKYLNLLDWQATGQVRAFPAVKYNRVAQFGDWILFKGQKCYDVRAQVLMRDSKVQATSIDKLPCTIEKGEWYDLYSGETFFEDGKIDIDHMVPLKEAYNSGADAWSREKRCVYANFTEMPEHLLSVSARENRTKSDRTPEKYMPPLKEYHCTYLKNWLTVKLVWKLSMTSNEASAIQHYLQEQNCDLSQFVIEKQRVAEARQKAQALEAICPVPMRQTVKKIFTRKLKTEDKK